MRGPASPGFGGWPMIPASTNGDPVGAMMAATRSTVLGLMALQSTKTGLALLAVSAGTKLCASVNASPGGKIDKMKSARAMSSSLAAVMPAALARVRVSSLRPSSEVRTVTPCSTSLLPTAPPMAPGAITATTGVIRDLAKQFRRATLSDRGRKWKQVYGLLEIGWRADTEHHLFATYRGDQANAMRRH